MATTGNIARLLAEDLPLPRDWLRQVSCDTCVWGKAAILLDKGIIIPPPSPPFPVPAIRIATRRGPDLPCLLFVSFRRRRRFSWCSCRGRGCCGCCGCHRRCGCHWRRRGVCRQWGSPPHLRRERYHKHTPSLAPPATDVPETPFNPPPPGVAPLVDDSTEDTMHREDKKKAGLSSTGVVLISVLVPAAVALFIALAAVRQRSSSNLQAALMESTAHPPPTDLNV